MNHSKRLIHFAFKEYVASKDDREYVMKITNLTSFTSGDSICVEFCSFNTRNEMFTDILDSGCKTVDEVEKLDTYNRYVVKRHKLYDMCVEPENKDEVVRQLRDYRISYDKFIRYINRCMYAYDKHVASLLRKYFVEYINEKMDRTYKHHIHCPGWPIV